MATLESGFASWARRRVRQAGNFARRPFSDKWLVVQATFVLGASRLAIRLLPYSRLERIMGERSTESAATVTPTELQRARRVAWAIRRVSSHTPWKSNCFPQALTAKILLRRRGIESTLYLGAAFKSGGEGLRAHAWSRCGRFYLTGGNSASQFGAVISYS